MSDGESSPKLAPIEPESAEDRDVTLGSDVDSETTSLAQSVLDYQYENGRRYHAYRSGRYVLPNDETEQDRLDMQHHSYLLVFGGELYRAPLTRVDRILDVGCGTGLWAMDFGDMHPKATVIATDLSAIQPTWVPPNVQFEIDDAEDNWEYSQPFDFIHIRGMGGSIGNWPRLMEQAYRNLRPGGWIEVTDYEAWASTDDNSLPESSAWHEYQTGLNEASQMFGRVMNISPKFKGFVQDAGFANVTEEMHKVPLSPWPRNKKLKYLGKFINVQMEKSIEAYALALFSRVLKWDADRIQVLFAGVRQDLRNLDYHMYTVLHCVTGRKPEQ